MDNDATRAIPRNLVAEKYRAIHDKRSVADLHTLAHIKRFLECYRANPQFRDKLQDNTDWPSSLIDAYGIDVDPRELLPLFHPDFRQFRFSEEVQRWPAAQLWLDYKTELATCADAYDEIARCTETSPRFEVWRQRQLRRCRSEFGVTEKIFPHSILAFELSAGCSVGCWFCGISAGRFAGNFLYTHDNARLWRSILDHVTDLFGTASQAGFCYWATDPSDNPDYLKFVEDYYSITGHLPQTTTAGPLRDLNFTRRLLQLGEERRCGIIRFSILSVKMLDAVHKTFTPDELLHVGLVLQNRESLSQKALVGRAAEWHRKQSNGGKTPHAASQFNTGQSTIACVTGFLVNMVTGTIQLITPTKHSTQWPLGYRTHGEARFGTAREFRTTIERLIGELPQHICSSDVLGFRDDLGYHGLSNGFELQSPSGQLFTFAGFAGAAELGHLIDEGDHTAEEIRFALTQNGVDVILIADALQKLFDHALLNEDPCLNGIASTRLPAV